MVSALRQAIQRMTEGEYLEFERADEIRHEFLDGDIFAMTGASEAHNLIAGNFFAILHLQMRGRSCKLYFADMRVKVPLSRLYTYPDITAVCGEAKFGDGYLDTLLNPVLIVEVLSPSTERYDRGKKFQFYRDLPSLQEYVLVAQDSPRIERYVRQADDVWQLTDVKGFEAHLELVSIGCTVALADVYEQVTFIAENDPNADA